MTGMVRSAMKLRLEPQISQRGLAAIAAAGEPVSPY